MIVMRESWLQDVNIVSGEVILGSVISTIFWLMEHEQCYLNTPDRKLLQM